jgi:2-oxoglutarate dehydrogenase E2 component (dihydrolipoamide succinyltransferase)
MSQVELIMPKMGESVAEATIIKWLKNEGDKIALDEPVLEIATDKVDSEIPSPFEGVLSKKLFNEGDVVQVGKAVALINTDVNASVKTAPVTAPAEEKKQEPVAEKVENKVVAQVNNPVAASTVKSSETSRFYSPLVRSIAKQEGISNAELETIPGTGAEGRVTKNDILNYLPNKGKVQPQVQKQVSETPVSSNGKETVQKTEIQKTETPQIHAPKITLMNGDEIVEMDRMRKLIADHMVMSKHVSPHVTSYVEVDVTNMVHWREKAKGIFEKRDK